MPDKVRKKKKRVSKHVLHSQEKQQEEPPSSSSSSKALSSPERPTASTAKQKQKKKKNHIKDPSEAASYLSSWKHRESGSSSGVWKFNKNTQSWLIRNMYDTDKLSKPTFAILLEYLQGMPQNSPGRDRVVEDAKRRALRYKEFEKKQQQAAKGDKQPSKEEEDGGDEQAKSTSPQEGGEDDATRWARLGENDKRKEYKRARKVLEVMRAEPDKTADTKED